MTMNVNLPTLTSFLLLYSLRCGSKIIFLWTMFRSLFYLIFFLLSTAEVFFMRSPLGLKFFSHAEEAPAAAMLLLILYSYIFMMITEALVCVHLIHFVISLCNESSSPLDIYLVCRFFTLLFEIVFLICLCFFHKVFIGWYLAFLLFVVLELYSFIVVYSYYVELKEEEDKIKCNNLQTCTA